MQANREAPTLRFTSGADQVPKTSTTAAIVDKHTPATQMEEEVAALLKQAGANSAKAIAEAEEALSLKVRPCCGTCWHCTGCAVRLS